MNAQLSLLAQPAEPTTPPDGRDAPMGTLPPSHTLCAPRPGCDCPGCVAARGRKGRRS